MGIFEAHKLMFSFQMTTMIMEDEKQLNRDELDFFLKGNTSLDAVERKPYEWMSDNGWKDAVRLNELGGVWNGIINNIKDYEREWKRWFDLENPEMHPIPCGYSEKLNKF